MNDLNVNPIFYLILYSSVLKFMRCREEDRHMSVAFVTHHDRFYIQIAFAPKASPHIVEKFARKFNFPKTQTNYLL